MGDRANVRMVDGGVCLYTHWSGERLIEQVKETLSRRERWDDTPYLTRMIFCTMVRGLEEESTGFGIYHAEDDDHLIEGYRVINVDNQNQKIRVVCYKKTTWEGSFEEFLSHEFTAEEW